MKVSDRVFIIFGICLPIFAILISVIKFGIPYDTDSFNNLAFGISSLALWTVVSTSLLALALFLRGGASRSLTIFGWLEVAISCFIFLLVCSGYFFGANAEGILWVLLLLGMINALTIPASLLILIFSLFRRA